MELRRREEARRLAIARRRNEELAHHGRALETADGRPHREVQTELYLEELTDHVEEMDASCQTDAFLDRPPSPLFVPAKTGLDVTTQVYDGDVRTSGFILLRVTIETEVWPLQSLLACDTLRYLVFVLQSSVAQWCLDPPGPKPLKKTCQLILMKSSANHLRKYVD